MGKKSRSEYEMSIPDHISESLETIFGIKKYLGTVLKIIDVDPDPESGIFLTLDPG